MGGHLSGGLLGFVGGDETATARFTLNLRSCVNKQIRAGEPHTLASGMKER